MSDAKHDDRVCKFRMPNLLKMRRTAHLVAKSLSKSLAEIACLSDSLNWTAGRTTGGLREAREDATGRDDTTESLVVKTNKFSGSSFCVNAMIV